MRTRMDPEEAYYVLLDSLRERKFPKEPKHKPACRLAYSAPAPPGEDKGFGSVRREIDSARRGLIALAKTDPVSASAHVRRIQCDRRRIWWPEVQARLHPVRPTLPRGEEE